MYSISRAKLRAFGERFPNARAPLDAWWKEAKSAKWKKPSDIKLKYGNASILKGGRVVFNIGGNKYRMVVKFDCAEEKGYIRFLGTHKGTVGKLG